MKINEIITESKAQTKTAVVGWGRGMGHKGHCYLVESVIYYAEQIGGTPFFYVSQTVGDDDPLTPEEKLNIYRQVFPNNKDIFKSAKSPIPLLNEILDMGFTDVVFMVGEDQKESFGFLSRPTKSTGELPVPFNSIKVMSRQESGSPSAELEGPHATPLRNILKGNSSTREKFAMWRDAMPDALSDKQVMSIMKLAAERMGFPIKGKLKEADQPPQGSLYSPLSATTRDREPPDPKAIIKAKREAKAMKKFMGHQN